MFNRDFYPTPKEVIKQMLDGVDVFNKVILEPSAGKGNIADYLNENGAKEILACEIDPTLRMTLNGKCNLIADDFLTLSREDVSHVDLIIMNPPFSNEEDHILHAWSIAPSGCEVISLCNNSVIERGTWGRKKKHQQIDELIETYGRSNSFGDCFKTSERYTDVNIGCIWLQKPIDEGEDFSNYFSMDEEIENQTNGIMQYNDIYEVVSRFTGSLKMFDEVMELNKRINDTASPIGGGNITFGATKNNGSITTAISRDTYRKELQKTAWKVVFYKLGADKYLTSSVREQLHRAIERQTNIPFTMKNIYLFVRALIQTHSSRMDDALVEAFDRICSLSAQNSTAGEKWKTNSDYCINIKFIDNNITRCESWTRHVTLHYSCHNRMEDVQKALCYLTGTDYDDTTTLESFVSRTEMEWGKWYSWGFFEIRGYKKGTMHFKFQDKKVWELFNRKIAEIKGWQLYKARNK